MGKAVENQEKIKKLAISLTDNDPAVTAQDWQNFDRDLFRFNESEKFAWYGACFGQTKRILTTIIPTACVGYKDGEILFAANPRFLEQLTFHQRCLVYCHEIEHIIRAHLTIMENYPEHRDMYNILADSLINEGLLNYNNIWARTDLPKFNNPESGEQVDMIDLPGLKKIIKNMENHGGIAQKQFNAKMTDEQFYRDHTTEGLVSYMPKIPKEDEDGNNILSSLIRGLYGENGEFFDDGSVPDEVKQAILQQMVEEAEKSRGLSPGHLAAYLDKIRDKTNRDWRMMMRGLGRSTHIKTTRSWVKWNRRNPSLDMPLKPGRYFKSLPKVLVMADTSGSVGDGELHGFIKEINGLTRRCIIDMAWVDAHFDPKDEKIFYRDVKDTKDFVRRAQTPVGRGGTYFGEFYKYAIDHYGEYQHILILTDGYSDMIPQRLAPGQQLALMTPHHSKEFVEHAHAAGFKVAVIEDLK